MAHILVAEDSDTVRDFVERALRLDGHSVVSVIDGGEALQALELEGFDLLLTDIVMPVMDGIALALKVAQDYPGLPILMMTGYAHERQRAHNLESLIQDVVPKPFTLDQICQAVRTALRQAQP